MLGFKAIGILLFKGFRALFPGLGHNGILVPEQIALLHIDGRFEQWRVVGIHLSPNIVVDKQHNAVGVIGEGRDIVGVEVGQQRHSHTAIGVDAPKGHCPPC